jgi:hypothetical protein
MGQLRKLASRGGGKTRGAYVRRTGEARADELRRESLANQDMPIEINHDRTLQTPFGEIKKKAIEGTAATAQSWDDPEGPQLQAGQPLSRTIFQRLLASRRQTELKVPMRFPEGSRTGPEVIANLPESSTSTVSGCHENGAGPPSKNLFQRPVT